MGFVRNGFSTVIGSDDLIGGGCAVVVDSGFSVAAGGGLCECTSAVFVAVGGAYSCNCSCINSGSFCFSVGGGNCDCSCGSSCCHSGRLIVGGVMSGWRLLLC